MKFARVILIAALTSVPTFALAAELLVLNKRDATLVFVDPASGKVGATVPTGEGPHEVEVSADGKLAFVSNYGAQTPGNSLTVVDIAARKEVKRIDLGDLRRPHGLSFSGGRLYLTAEDAKKVASVDPAALRVDWTFDTTQERTHMVLATADGKKLFTTNMGSNSVSMIERGANGTWSQKLITVGGGPEGLDLSPDGKSLWTAHSRDGGMSVIDTASGKVLHTFDAKTQRSNRVKFTRDGKLALVSDLSGGELVVIDAATRTERARLKLGRAPTGILVPPTGDEVFVAVSGENHIAVVDLKAMKVSRKITPGNDPDGMAWVR
jgi:YVTN family beta-propeller protein